MTNIIASLFSNVHPSKAKLTMFGDGNCFLIGSTVSAYFLRQMLVGLKADGSTRLSRNALYDRRSSRYDIASHGIWAETNPNMR